MRHALFPLLLIAVLSGCETLGFDSGPSASIEDRSGSGTGATAATVPSKGGATPSGTAATGGVETAGLGGVAPGAQPLDAKPLDGTVTAGAKGADPRKDPASPLSKRSIYFDYDSFVVRDEYRPVIEAHAAYLMGHRSARVILQGNADSRGSREYNLALGQKRAEAVLKALSVLGVQEEQLEAVSFGEEKPRAAGETDADFAENRRADVVYTDE
mgnify:CR=1 FL=1